MALEAWRVVCLGGGKRAWTSRFVLPLELEIEDQEVKIDPKGCQKMPAKNMRGRI